MFSLYNLKRTKAGMKRAQWCIMKWRQKSVWQTQLSIRVPIRIDFYYEWFLIRVDSYYDSYYDTGFITSWFLFKRVGTIWVLIYTSRDYTGSYLYKSGLYG